MLFSHAFRGLLGRRSLSTGVPVEEVVSSGAGALVAAVGTTFGTYMLADFLSNFLQHPTQKVRVGETRERELIVSLSTRIY